MMKNSYFFLNLFFLVSFLACGNSGTTKDGTVDNFVTRQKNETKPNLMLSAQVNSNKITQGENVTLSFSPIQGLDLDSVVWSVNGRKHGRITQNEPAILKTDQNTPVGQMTFQVKAFKAGQTQTILLPVLIAPKESPKYYRVKVNRTLPHEETAYTQGIEFMGNKLVQSTGEYNMSELQLLEMPSMKVIKRITLPKNYFGEGVTLLGGKIYQLTWMEHKVLVYNADTFKKEREIDYAKDGWGLTNDGRYLYASDGSEKIYKIDPENFNIVATVQVFSGTTPIRNINEMEWIEGEIWANVYGEEAVLRIKPQTGAVVGIIDASGLLGSKEIKPNTDVLNGIAYDRQTKKIYLTGKNWPKIFEVEVVVQ